MRTTNSFSISFFLKKDKAAKGYAPFYVRITVNHKSVDISLKRRIRIASWNQLAQRYDGKDEEAAAIREKIRQTRNDINSIYDQLRYEKQVISAAAIKAKLEGEEEDEQITLCWLLTYHNTQMGKLLEPGTMKNYFSTERYIKEFLTKKRRRPDIYLSQLDYKFVADFEVYLRLREPDPGQRPCGNNTVMKHIERLRKMLNIALKNDWIVKDPFSRFQRNMISKDREALEAKELELISGLNLEQEGHRIVRDMFVFSCYTGLAHADVCQLSREHIITEPDGEQWIEMIRKKTSTSTRKKFYVLLLPKAIELIKQYKDHPAALHKGTIFPVYSNQATNRYLKVIKKHAGLNREITFHIARHTFATTITLENGVPMESVSKMLGHASIRTTQIYSKVRKKKVGSDMKELREKMNSNLVY